MRANKRKRLEAAGWKVGSADDFLELTPEESELVELRIRLVDGIRQLRRRRRLTQVAFAKRIGSSQSRVAKIEAGDASVSIDLLLRAYFAGGASRHELAALISADKA